MSSHTAEQFRDEDPLDSTPAPEPSVQSASNRPSHSRAKAPDRAKNYRPLIGAVDMLDENWLFYFRHWQCQVTECTSLSKLAIKIAVQMSLSVDIDKGSHTAGYAVRSHDFFARKLHSKRNKIQVAIQELENLGFVKIERSTREGYANRYQLRFPPHVFWAIGDDRPPF